jgi:hypothetical protein
MTSRSTCAYRAARHRLRLRMTTGRGTSFTVNVSPGGACTEQMRNVPVGVQVAGVIRLGGRDAVYTGRVIWAREGDQRLNALGRMGVRFDRIGPELACGLDERNARSMPHALAA